MYEIKIHFAHFSVFILHFFHTFFTECIIINNMRIAEIPQMSEITIKMVYNNADFAMKTRVLTVYGEGILVTPITFEGQLVEYCPKAQIEYTEPGTGLKHIFETKSISRTDFNGTDFHVITGNEIIISDRHRKAERYMVQVMGNAVVNKRKAINVIVNDISMRGISLLIGKGQSVKLGDELELSFFKNGIMKRIQVQCKVVRMFKVGNFEAAGCVLSSIDNDLLLYVAEKKREYNEKCNVKIAG